MAAFLYGLYGLGHHLGAAAVQVKWDAELAAVDKLAAETKAHNQAVIAEQQQVTKKTVDDYERRLKDIRDYYASSTTTVHYGLCDPAPRPRPVPAIPDATGGTHAGAADEVPARSDTILEACVETTAQILALQGWVREQVK